MPRRKKPKSIHLSGRRWFRKTFGNTYHSVAIYVDGVCVHKCGQQYGYGEQYVWTARAWLAENGYLPKLGENESLWRYCDEHKIAYVADVSDVARERDL